MKPFPREECGEKRAALPVEPGAIRARGEDASGGDFSACEFLLPTNTSAALPLAKKFGERIGDLASTQTDR